MFVGHNNLFITYTLHYFQNIFIKYLFRFNKRGDIMAKKTYDPHKCCPLCAWIILVVGVLYLLKDLGVANLTFGIQWYTVLFVLMGLKFLMMRK